MKQICKTLGIISLIVGTIGSFVLAYAAGSTFSISRYGTLDKVRNWPLTFVYFVACILCASAFSFILLGISEILERLELLSKDQSALILNFTADEVKEPPQDYWKCPNCGKSNPPYAGTCGCGHSKL